MPAIGNGAKPDVWGGEYYGSTFNQVGELLTMPERGRITRLGGWLSGSSNMNFLCRLTIWNSAGVRLGQSAEFTVHSAPTPSTQHDIAANVQRYERDLEAAVELDAGVSFYVGFTRPANRAHQLLRGSSGGHLCAKNTPYPDAAFTGRTSHTGRVGLNVVNYDPVSGAWIRRGGAWTRAEGVKIRRGGAWIDAERVAVRRSGAWNDAD